MRRKIWCFATALTALLSTAAADAKPIEYTFSGTGDWTLNGLGGSGDFVVNLTADTSKIVGGMEGRPMEGRPGGNPFSSPTQIAALRPAAVHQR